MAMAVAAPYVSSDYAAGLRHHAQISFSSQSICKYSFPDLETAADYHQWITDVKNQMKGDCIHDDVMAMVEKR